MGAGTRKELGKPPPRGGPGVSVCKAVEVGSLGAFLFFWGGGGGGGGGGGLLNC